MPTVELIYDDDCPNAADARSQLKSALAKVGLDLTWKEWRRGDPDSPSYVRRYGSPTILVDGADVAGAAPTDGADCCRLYGVESGRIEGVPSIETIVSALKAGRAKSGRVSEPPKGGSTWLAAMPAVLVAVLPAVTCPACWPAYAGLLGAMGLPFLMNSTYLFPLTVVFLAVAVGALAIQARRRRLRVPLVFGILAAVLIIGGKFFLDSTPLSYAGIALLVAMSIRDAWPKQSAPMATCASCGTR